IGKNIAEREQQEIQNGFQLELPVIVGEPIPILYIEMDGTGVPVVRKETQDRAGKTPGQPAHTREVKLGCVFTQTQYDDQGYAIRDPQSTTYTGAIESAEQFGKRIFLEAWKRGWSRGLIEKLVSSLRAIDSSDPELLETIRIQTDYFEKNAERMRYPEFRRQHLFIGSGVIEAGCKTVIGSRTKQSGMFWTVLGANAIIALRCCQLNGRFEDYWEARRA